MSDLATDPSQEVETASPEAARRSDTQREDTRPEPDEKTKNFVNQLCKDVKADKKRWESDFERIDFDTRFAKGQQWVDANGKLIDDDDLYVANLVQKHIQGRVQAIYAKNPTAVHKLAERLEFAIWNGDPAVYQEALAMVMQADEMQVPPPPGAAEIVEDVQAGIAARERLDNIGKSLTIVFHYFLKEQEPGFKKMMKKVVRRAKTSGVGYVRLNYQRVMGRNPSDEKGIRDYQQRLEHIRSLRADMADGETTEDDAEAKELEEALETLLSKDEIILREGLIFDYPKAKQVIPGRDCVQLDGFVGASRVTVEHIRTPDRIKEIYGIDITGAYKRYIKNKDGSLTEQSKGDADEDQGLALLWQVYHKPSGNMYTIVDGFDDFLEEPDAPTAEVERFYPIYALVFNDMEDDDSIYPKSDVQLMKHPQMEHNRSRDALRAHRWASRPLYAAKRGAFEEDEAASIQQHAAHDIIFLSALGDGQKIEDIFSQVNKVGIDPNLYETNTIFDDLQKVVGSQETNFGGTSGATATEVADSAGERMSSVSDDVDMIDDLMAELARDSSKVLLQEVSMETAQHIVGPGVVWPTMTGREVAEEVGLEIVAGSTGRPNQAQEVANMERATPMLLQLPGINPEWLTGEYLEVLRPGFDRTEAMLSGSPPILAISRLMQAEQQAQLAPADPTKDPTAQGPEGADNAPVADSTQPGGQPGFPTQIPGTVA